MSLQDSEDTGAARWKNNLLATPAVHVRREKPQINPISLLRPAIVRAGPVAHPELLPTSKDGLSIATVARQSAVFTVCTVARDCAAAQTQGQHTAVWRVGRKLFCARMRLSLVSLMKIKWACREIWA